MRVPETDRVRQVAWAEYWERRKSSRPRGLHGIKKFKIWVQSRTGLKYKVTTPYGAKLKRKRRAANRIAHQTRKGNR